MSLEKSQNELPALKKTGGHYDRLAVQKIVEAIEGGMPRSEIYLIYGLSRSTVCGWMREYGSPSYQASHRGQLTQAQKRSMIRAIREGRMTLQEAKLAYQENGDLSADMNKEAHFVPPQEDPENKALEKALQEAHLKIKALNTLIDVAEDQFKIPIRKKPGARQSKP
ncbi:MAG: hypothetical protein Q8937_17945 [Bacteroidota bacterium]|nr:hypothetical protein [Bacteroidota bacterium]